MSCLLDNTHEAPSDKGTCLYVCLCTAHTYAWVCVLYGYYGYMCLWLQEMIMFFLSPAFKLRVIFTPKLMFSLHYCQNHKFLWLLLWQRWRKRIYSLLLLFLFKTPNPIKGFFRHCGSAKYKEKLPIYRQCLQITKVIIIL